MKRPIDKYFEEKLKHRTFDVQADDWAKMQVLLEKEKKSKRPIFWIWMFGLALLLGGVYTVYRLQTNGADQVSKENVDVVLNDAPAEALNPISEMESEKSLPTQPSASVTSKEEHVNKTPIIQKSNIVNHASTADNTISKKSDDVVNKIKTDKVLNQTLDVPVLENVEDENQPFENKVNTDLAVITDSSNDLVEIGPEKIMDHAENDESLNTTVTQSREKVVIDKLDAKTNGLISNQEISIVAIHVTPDASDKDRIIDYSPDIPMSTSLSIYAGASYYPYNSETNGFFQGYAAGIAYTHRLSDNLGLTSGLGIRKLSGTYNEAETSTVTVNSNGFGWKRDYLTLTPTDIYYVEVPIALQMKKRKHIFSAGINANVALATRGIKRTEGYSQAELVGQIHSRVTSKNVSERDVWMSSSSFNPVYAQATLGYAYQLSPSLNLGLGVEYGINKISGEDLLIDNKPLSIRVTAAFNLWKK